ncbi:hypothetical protein DFS34DRAFT_668853 [Phlyctochytrium arcticum]|nr:hypothetical protein DFS34DRAFT_668853 [Phlyctochytrium arcticum]
MGPDGSQKGSLESFFLRQSQQHEATTRAATSSAGNSATLSTPATTASTSPSAAVGDVSNVNASSQANTVPAFQSAVHKRTRGPGPARQQYPFQTSMQVPSSRTDAAKNALGLHTARQNVLQAGKGQLLPRVKVELARTYLDFGGFDDEHWYKGFIPSEHYLSTVYTQLFKMVVLVEASGKKWTLEEYMHRHQQLIDGQVWGPDGLHKEAMKMVIRGRRADVNAQSHRPIIGLYTINNEYSQIVLQVPMLTHALSDLTDRMRLLALRYKMHGFDNVKAIWSDDCCSDHNLWEKIFQGINRETNRASKLLISGVEELPTLPVFTFPEGVHYQYVKGEDDAARNACDKLLTIAEAHARHFDHQLILGFDAEWNCDIIKSTKRDKNESRKQLPVCIKTLLEDKRIKFVGASIKGDFTRLLSPYEVSVCPDRMIDLYLLSKERKISCNMGRGLDHMVEAFFGEQPEKILRRDCLIGKDHH